MIIYDFAEWMVHLTPDFKDIFKWWRRLVPHTSFFRNHVPHSNSSIFQHPRFQHHSNANEIKVKTRSFFSRNISRKWHFNFAINLEICWRRKLNNHTLQSSLLFGPCPINIPYILKWNDKLKVPRKIYPKKMLMILKQFNNLLSKYIISTMLKEGQFAYFAIE